MSATQEQLEEKQQLQWYCELLRRALDCTDDIGEATEAAELALSMQPWPDEAFLAVSPDEWQTYASPSGKVAWKNSRTGETRYQQNKPGQRKPKEVKAPQGPYTPIEKEAVPEAKPVEQKPMPTAPEPVAATTPTPPSAPVSPAPTQSPAQQAKLDARLKELLELDQFSFEDRAPKDEEYWPRDGATGNAELPEQSRPTDLTATEKQAIDAYGGNGFRLLNFTKHHGMEDKQHEKAKFIDKNLQSAFAKTQDFAQPVEVFRGVGFEEGDDEALKELQSSLVKAYESKESLPIKGYLSTTTDKEKFEKSYSGGTNRNINFRIKAKKGIDIGPYTNQNTEKELLLNHGSKFKVNGISRGVGGSWLVDLEQET